MHYKNILIPAKNKGYFPKIYEKVLVNPIKPIYNNIILDIWRKTGEFVNSVNVCDMYKIASRSSSLICKLLSDSFNLKCCIGCVNIVTSTGIVSPIMYIELDGEIVYICGCLGVRNGSYMAYINEIYILSREMTNNEISLYQHLVGESYNIIKERQICNGFLGDFEESDLGKKVICYVNTAKENKRLCFNKLCINSAEIKCKKCKQTYYCSDDCMNADLHRHTPLCEI